MSKFKMKKKGGIGRGLGALMGDEAVPDYQFQRVRTLPIEDVVPNPRQPRSQMDEAVLEDLASSIRTHGVLQPILTRRITREVEGMPRTLYELVAGERRWRASRKAGLTEIPALVREMGDEEALEIAILENVQREDLGPVDVARGYARLVEEFGYSHDQVGQKIGKSRMAVSNLIRLLKLPDTVLEHLAAGRLTSGHARALLGLKGSVLMMEQAAVKIMARGWNVRETERWVAGHSGEVQKKGNTRGGRATVRKEPAIRAMEEDLASDLQTTVAITHRRGRGRIVVDYDTLEQLEALVGRLKKDT